AATGRAGAARLKTPVAASNAGSPGNATLASRSLTVVIAGMPPVRVVRAVRWYSKRAAKCHARLPAPTSSRLLCDIPAGDIPGSSQLLDAVVMRLLVVL